MRKQQFIVSDINASLITIGESPIKKPELKEKRYAKTKLQKTDRTLQQKMKTVPARTF